MQSFRGLVAGLVMPAGRNREVLDDTLGRLGLCVLALDPCQAIAADDAAPLDLLIVDNDLPEATAAAAAIAAARALPIIAVIGLETPSRLQRALELEPLAMLAKPIRASGVYSAIYVAVNGHRRVQEQRQRLAELEARHAARRIVLKAVLCLMERHGCGDDHAFRLLRMESMRQRIALEQLAARVVAEGETAQRAARDAGAPGR